MTVLDASVAPAETLAAAFPSGLQKRMSTGSPPLRSPYHPSVPGIVGLRLRVALVPV